MVPDFIRRESCRSCTTDVPDGVVGRHKVGQQKAAGSRTIREAATFGVAFD
jgi:hypothetical protein